MTPHGHTIPERCRPVVSLVCLRLNCTAKSDKQFDIWQNRTGVSRWQTEIRPSDVVSATCSVQLMEIYSGVKNQLVGDEVEEEGENSKRKDHIQFSPPRCRVGCGVGSVPITITYTRRQGRKFDLSMGLRQIVSEVAE